MVTCQPARGCPPRYPESVDLGPVGIWWSGTWRAGDDASVDVAAEMEDLGYGALWSSGGFDPGLAPRFERLLAATTRVVVASGIVSIWVASPGEISRRVADLDATYPGRFLLGLGASHAPVVEGYSRPYSHMVRYLDGLDAAGVVTKQRRVLAALGPRMLELAGDRAAGAHPYFVPVEHTARARKILGTGPLLAPEVTVVLERDPVDGAGAGPDLHDRLPEPSPTTPTISGPSGSTRRTWPAEAATAWSMPSWPGGTSTPWPSGCGPTTTPGPTTSASRSSSPGGSRFPSAEYRELAAALTGSMTFDVPLTGPFTRTYDPINRTQCPIDRRPRPDGLV